MGSRQTNSCVHNYVDQNAAMLDAKRLAGVAPEVYLLHTSDETCKRGTHSGLKSRADVTRRPKQGYQFSDKNYLRSPNILKKRSNHVFH